MQEPPDKIPVETQGARVVAETEAEFRAAVELRLSRLRSTGKKFGLSAERIAAKVKAVKSPPGMSAATRNQIIKEAAEKVAQKQSLAAVAGAGAPAAATAVASPAAAQKAAQQVMGMMTGEIAPGPGGVVGPGSTVASKTGLSLGETERLMGGTLMSPGKVSGPGAAVTGKMMTSSEPVAPKTPAAEGGKIMKFVKSPAGIATIAALAGYYFFNKLLMKPQEEGHRFDMMGQQIDLQQAQSPKANDLVTQALLGDANQIRQAQVASMFGGGQVAGPSRADQQMEMLRNLQIMQKQQALSQSETMMGGPRQGGQGGGLLSMFGM